jgi:uncharacterized protein YcfJ
MRKVLFIFLAGHSATAVTSAMADDNAAVGAVLGGITGGLLGNQIGHGTGRAVATGLGALIGIEAGRAIGSSMSQNPYQNSYYYRESQYPNYFGGTGYGSYGYSYRPSYGLQMAPRPRNGEVWGTMIGGAAGGILGNQIGRGDGRIVSTVFGTIVGAAVGNSVGRYVDSSSEYLTYVPVQENQTYVPAQLRYRNRPSVAPVANAPENERFLMQGYQRGPSPSIYPTPYGYPVR